MHTEFAEARRPRAVIVLFALFISSTSFLLLLSYCSMLQTRCLMSAAALAWTNAVPLAQVGIEETFAELRMDTNLNAKGWFNMEIGQNGATVYQNRRQFADGSYCLLSLSNNANSTTLCAEGFVRAPLSKRFLSRRVMVTTTNESLESDQIAGKSSDSNARALVWRSM